MTIRDIILQKSYETFYQRGFHDSGVELLAKQAGTTKRTLYAHFGNKEGLIEEVLKYRHERFMTQLSDSFNQVDTKQVSDVTTCYLDFLKNWTSSTGFYGCMFINACAEFSNPESLPHQIANQHKTEVRQVLLKKFKEVNASNCQQKADTLFVFGEGVIVAAQTGQQSLAVDTSFLIDLIAV